MVQAPMDLPMLELLHLRLREHPGRLSGEINLLKGLLTPWTDRLQHGGDFVEISTLKEDAEYHTLSEYEGGCIAGIFR